MKEAFNAKLKRFYKSLNGSTIEYNLAPYIEILDEIKKYEPQLKKNTDNQLKQISQELIVGARKNMDLDDLLVKAYSLVFETVYRVFNLKPFDVQIIGAIAMHQSKLVEMQTGEGKTLAAVFADSILIDEARNPLVIAGTSDTHISDVYQTVKIARELEIDRNLKLDESARNIYLKKWVDINIHTIVYNIYQLNDQN